MKIMFLLVFFELGLILTQALYFDDGCEVKSEWEYDYKWTTVSIGSWIPHEEDSTVLIIEIEIKGYTYPHSYDRLEVGNQEIKFMQKRDGQSKQENKTISYLKPGHWADFVFNVDSHHSLMYLNSGNKTLFKKEVAGFPAKLRMIGNNITINCHSNSRVWSVDGGKSVVIPLEDENVDGFTFYSTEEYVVKFELEKRTFSLGWYNGSLTTIPKEFKPLPRFEEHHLELECREESKVKCDIKIGENRDVAEKDILMIGMPKSLTVRSNENKFFVIMNRISNDIKSATPSETTLTPSEMPTPTSCIEEKFGAVATFLTITTVVLVIAVVILSFLYLRSRNVIMVKQSKVNKGEKKSISKELEGAGYENELEALTKRNDKPTINGMEAGDSTVRNSD